MGMAQKIFHMLCKNSFLCGRPFYNLFAEYDKVNGVINQVSRGLSLHTRMLVHCCTPTLGLGTQYVQFPTVHVLKKPLYPSGNLAETWISPNVVLKATSLTI